MYKQRITASEFRQMQVTNKPKRKNSNPEKQFQDAAAQMLMYNGFVVMRINSSALVAPESKTFLRSYYIYNLGNEGSKGFPDLLAFKAPDRFLLIEAKSGKNGLSKSQKQFKTYMESKGFTLHIATTIDEIQTIIKDFK